MSNLTPWTSLLLSIQAYPQSRGLPPLLTTAVYILLAFGILALILSVALTERPRIQDTIGHWHATIPGLQLSPERFYEVLHIEIDRPMTGPPVDIKTVYLVEGDFRAHYRPYLQVRHLKLAYYVFAAPLGNSFFVSSWLVIRRPVLSRVLPRLPIIGWVISGMARLFDSYTFFTVDSALHFHEMTHAAVLRTVDKLTSTAKIPALPPDLRKPVMRELYAQPLVPQLAPPL